MMRPITLTMSDGTVIDAMLLSPASDTGEGSSVRLATPFPRDSGPLTPIEVKAGVDADNFVEV